MRVHTKKINLLVLYPTTFRRIIVWNVRNHTNFSYFCEVITRVKCEGGILIASLQTTRQARKSRLLLILRRSLTRTAQLTAEINSYFVFDFFNISSFCLFFVSISRFGVNTQLQIILFYSVFVDQSLTANLPIYI